MGKWAYVNDENNTNMQNLKRMANKLITASTKTKVDVNVEFQSRSKELKSPTVNITFFTNNDNFTITLYSFYSIEKNTTLLNSAIELMKNSTKYEEIKDEIHKKV